MQQDYNAIWITATKDPASGNVRWGSGLNQNMIQRRRCRLWPITS